MNPLKEQPKKKQKKNRDHEQKTIMIKNLGHDPFKKESVNVCRQMPSTTKPLTHNLSSSPLCDAARCHKAP